MPSSESEYTGPLDATRHLVGHSFIVFFIDNDLGTKSSVNNI